MRGLDFKPEALANPKPVLGFRVLGFRGSGLVGFLLRSWGSGVMRFWASGGLRCRLFRVQGFRV